MLNEIEAPPGLLERLSQPDRPTLQAILNLLDPLSIALRVPEPTSHRSKYTLLRHAELCRLKMLGLTDANCARAIGIRPNTLQDWTHQHPQLELDMRQAAQLATAEVVKLLFTFMHEHGPVALNAVKFFLSTRTEEFREKAEVSVKGVDPAGLATAVESIYGITRAERAGGGQELP